MQKEVELNVIKWCSPVLVDTLDSLAETLAASSIVER